GQMTRMPATSLRLARMESREIGKPLRYIFSIMLIGLLMRLLIESMGLCPSPKRASRCRLSSLVRRSEEHTSELQSRFDLVCRRHSDASLVPYTSLFRSGADDPDARNVVEVGAHGIQGNREALAVHLFDNAHRALDAALDRVDGVVPLSKTGVPLQNFQLGA